MSQRRSSGGSRRAASERVVLSQEGRTLTGWTLNVSRGGVRLVLEGAVRTGDSFGIAFGTGDEPRAGRVVWVRDEADGQIVGLEFTGVGKPPAVPPDSD